MTDLKARALRAEAQLAAEHRHNHPLPNYYPGCSACEEDRRKERDPSQPGKGGG